MKSTIRRILRESWFTKMFTKPIASFQDYNSYRYGLDETYEVYEEKNDYVIVNNTSHDSTIIKSLPKSEYSKKQVIDIALGLSEEYSFPVTIIMV